MRIQKIIINRFGSLNNIEAEPNCTSLRISGKTGCGKTTFISAILFLYSGQDAKGHKRIPGADIYCAATREDHRQSPIPPALLFPQIHQQHPASLVKEILHPDLARLESEAKKIKNKIKFLSEMSEYLQSCGNVPPQRIIDEKIALMRTLDELSQQIDELTDALSKDQLYQKYSATKDYHYFSYAEKVKLLFDCVFDIEDTLGVSYFKLIDDGERLSPSFISDVKKRTQVIYTWKEYDKGLTITKEE